MELRMGMQGVNDRAWNAAWINMSLSLDDVGRLGELQSDLGWPSHQCPTPAHRTQSIGTFSAPPPQRASSVGINQRSAGNASVFIS